MQIARLSLFGVKEKMRYAAHAASGTPAPKIARIPIGLTLLLVLRRTASPFCKKPLAVMNKTANKTTAPTSSRSMRRRFIRPFSRPLIVRRQSNGGGPRVLRLRHYAFVPTTSSNIEVLSISSRSTMFS